MHPEKLTRLLTGLERAAEVVDAIDNQETQRQRGWDLSHWRYELVPWGVRFIYEHPAKGPFQIVAVIPPGARSQFAHREPSEPAFTTVLLMA